MSGAGDDKSAAQQQADDVCGTMQAALAALKGGSDASCPQPSRQQVQAAVQLLRMEVAKMGLVYRGTGGSTGSGTPSEAELTALLSGFQQAACTLCMLYSGIAAAGGEGGGGGGPTLRQSVHQTATSVLEACMALIRGAVGGNAQDAQLMLLSGFFLEMLDTAGRAPLDSRTAIGRAITQVLKQLADALKELDGTIQEAAEALQPQDKEEDREAAGAPPTAGAGQAEVEEGSDGGFGFDQEDFDAGQLAVARGVRGLLAETVALLKLLVKQLLAEREGLSAEGVEGWESMLYHIKTLPPVCDDLAAAVYPPQEAEELSSAAESLATICDLLVDECPLPGTAGAAEQQEGQGEEQRQAAAADALRAALRGVQAAQEQLLAGQLAAADDAAAAE